MSLDPAIERHLIREFEAFDVGFDPSVRHALAEVRQRVAFESGGSGGSGLAHAIDRKCASKLSQRVEYYLETTVARLADLRLPWTEAIRMAVEDLLKRHLDRSVSWITTLRELFVGPQKTERASGVISAATEALRHKIEVRLAYQVLREDRRRLPLLDLLSPPRYAAVLRHWEAACRYSTGTPPSEYDSTREAIHAVEALAKLAAGTPHGTLGTALASLGSRADDAGRLLFASLEKLWAFTNKTPGTRHGGGPGDDVTAPEAQFVVGVAEHALRLLLTFDLGDD